MRRPILVTGGAGYIGAHTCKALHANGFLPVVVDSLVLGHESFVKWGPLVKCDIRDADQVTSVIREFGIEHVMHFAAYAYVGESVTDPAKYYDNNVTATLGLLNAIKEAGCANIVFSSTCAVYGQPVALPITEKTPLAPVNPYGRTKVVAEQMISDFSAAYGLNAVRLRYFNAAGDDPDGEIGENREVETHLIPRAMMHLLGHLDDFEVFGGDYETPDGTAIRDYIHVSDLAEGHLLALKRLSPGTNEVFNLGTGHGYSVKEVLAAIERATGHSLAVRNAPRRSGDPAVLVADVSRAERDLGFKAKLASIDEIVGTAWRWHQKVHPMKAAGEASGKI